MNISIRNVRPEDALEVTKLLHETWLATYPNETAGITRADIEYRYKNAYAPERMLKRAENIKNLSATERYIAAEIDSKIVGVASMVCYADFNQLQLIYVLPAYQGKGVGQALWKEVRKSIDSDKKTIVHVATYNNGAIVFYKKLGFAETGKIFTDERFKMQSGNMIPETELILI